MRHYPLSHFVETVARAALKIAAATTLVVGFLGAQSASASAQDDHDRARQALQSGQILPLSIVLQALERDHPGQVLEVELEQEGERWIYEIKLLQADGQLLKLKMDARTALLLPRKAYAARGKPDEKR
jgi:uncharacterized membrane protein YkoI